MENRTKKNEIQKKWNVVRLRDVVLDFICGGTPSTKIQAYWNGKIPWMTSAHIEGKTIMHGMQNITEEGVKNSATNIVPANNILMATRVGIGKIAINLIDIAISQDLTGLLLDHKKINIEYAYWLLANYTDKLTKLSQGSTIKGLLRDEIKRIEIPLPPLPEQKKIAEILGTVDEAIEDVDNAIDKTERLKKELMQELLTRGIGHKEFKDTEIGRIPKVWEVVKLEKVLKDINSGFASGKRDDNGIIQIRMNNVTTDGKIIFDSYLKVPIPTNIENWLLKNGDFLFNNTNSYDLVGKSAVVQETPFPCTYSNHFTRIRFRMDMANPNFILYHFLILWRKGYFKTVAIRHVGQSAVNSIYLLNLTIPLPPIIEQQEILDILESLSMKENLLAEKKEKFVRLKKQLMNDLLTGKRRVVFENANKIQ
jgi:type I restriction enzyme S subunit